MKSQKSIGDTGVISRSRNTCNYCLLPYSEKQMKTKWRSSRLFQEVQRLIQVIWMVSSFIVEEFQSGTYRFFVVCLVEHVQSEIPLDKKQSLLYFQEKLYTSSSRWTTACQASAVGKVPDKKNSHSSWKEVRHIHNLFAYFCFIFAFDKTPVHYFWLTLEIFKAERPDLGGFIILLHMQQTSNSVECIMKQMVP